MLVGSLKVNFSTGKLNVTVLSVAVGATLRLPATSLTRPTAMLGITVPLEVALVSVKVQLWLPLTTGASTQLTSAGTFEYWDFSGIRRTGSGDADIIATNVKNGITFEKLGVTGSFTAGLGVWDVRAGISFGDSQVGKLKVNCRNSINSATYNWDGTLSSATSLPISSQTSGTVFDYWDTIVNYLGQPASTGFPSTWSVPNNYCGGIATSVTDNVWLDVTTTSPPCNATNCRYKDKISGLEWSKSSPNLGWSAGMFYCATLTHDGVTGASRRRRRW